MSDTKIIWLPWGNRGDWSLVGQQLETGSDIETAILISIFTDRQANPDDVIPDGTNNPRGWWGDSGQDKPIGSRLWLLERAKQTTQTLQSAHDYISEALQWMIDDGVVAKFDIYCEWSSSGKLGAKVVAYRKDGTNIATNFSWAWKN